jgi:hypothetical protein
MAQVVTPACSGVTYCFPELRNQTVPLAVPTSSPFVLLTYKALGLPLEQLDYYNFLTSKG